MPAWGTILAFAAAAFVIIVVPGPSVLFTIGRSLALGRAAGIISVLGTTVGAFLLTAVVALGIGTLITASPVAFLVIKYAGAAYLVYLGVTTILGRRKAAQATLDAVPQPRWRIFLSSLLVAVTNPKTIAFFVAILPQFVDPALAWPPSLQLLLFGLIWGVLGFPSDGAWALAAGSARDWFARTPTRLEALTATGGAVMIVLGLALALVH